MKKSRGEKRRKMGGEERIREERRKGDGIK